MNKTKRIFSLILSVCMILSGLRVFATGTLPAESQLQDIINDNFTVLSGKSEDEIRTTLANMGYEINEGRSDSMSFSATEEKGLYIKRNGTTDDLRLTRAVSDSSGITGDNTLLPGHNMKGGGKYYVEYTFSYDRTAVRVDGAGNWKNVFIRTDINAAHPNNLTVYSSDSGYTLESETSEMRVQAVVDTNVGNSDGKTAQCVSNVFVNGEHVGVDIDNEYVYNNVSYYTTYLQNMTFTLMKGSNAVDGGGMYLKNFRVAKIDDVTIEGIANTAFVGGTLKKTAQMNFADMFEGDGSNGTNGTVPYEKDGKTEGLKAQKTDGGIKFSRAGTEGANPGRAQAILDVTYPLPEIENPNAPYYVELSFQACVSSAVNFDFGQNEGNDGVLLGNNGVVRVRKLDSYTGSDGVAAPIEGPAAYAYSTDDTIRANAEYSEGENATIGLYVIPALKEMVFYKDGEMISDKIYTYSNSESVLETLRVTWYQSIRWYNIPESDYLTLKGVKVYQGSDLKPDKVLAVISGVVVNGEKVTALEQLAKGANANIEIEYRNPTGEAQPLIVIVAYYNSSTLQYVEIVKADSIASDRTSETLSYPFTVSDMTDVTQIKVMAWDTLSNMVPLAESYSIPVI